MAKIFTDEVKAQICAEYQDRNIRTTDILNRYKLSSGQFRDIINEAGIPPRNSNKWGKKKDFSGHIIKEVCPKCKKERASKDARFCWYCGEDIRTAKQLLVERLEVLTDYYDHIPIPVRDEYIRTINDAIAELKK